MAVPSHGFRDGPDGPGDRALADDLPILSLTKGIEQDTLHADDRGDRPVLPDHDPTRTGVLTGPNLAKEVGRGAGCRRDRDEGRVGTAALSRRHSWTRRFGCTPTPT
jgi:glycerol-3-phosphate dehydrogenase